MNNFRLVVLSEEGNIFEGMVDKVIVNTSMGEITVLKNHIPLISTVVDGRLIIFVGSKMEEYIASGGLLKVSKDEVLLMCNKIIKK